MSLITNVTLLQISSITWLLWDPFWYLTLLLFLRKLQFYWWLPRDHPTWDLTDFFKFVLFLLPKHVSLCRRVFGGKCPYQLRYTTCIVCNQWIVLLFPSGRVHKSRQPARRSETKNWSERDITPVLKRHLASVWENTIVIPSRWYNTDHQNTII